jgi:hypothetical protein
MMLLSFCWFFALIHSVPTCQAFTAPFVLQKTAPTSSVVLAGSRSQWFSSLPDDHDLWTKDEDVKQPQSGLKVMGEDGDTVMNEVSMDRNQIQQSLNNKLQNENGGKRKVRASVKETGYDSMRNYMKSVCQHNLLSKNEEILLAREIQVLIKWEEEREKLEEQLLR